MAYNELGHVARESPERKQQGDMKDGEKLDSPPAAEQNKRSWYQNVVLLAQDKGLQQRRVSAGPRRIKANRLLLLAVTKENAKLWKLYPQMESGTSPRGLVT